MRDKYQRAECLARAHLGLLVASANGAARVEWAEDSDFDMGNLDFEEDREAIRSGTHVVLYCAIHRPDARGNWHVVENIGGVIVTGYDDPYCKVIEAELAVAAGYGKDRNDLLSEIADVLFGEDRKGRAEWKRGDMDKIADLVILAGMGPTFDPPRGR